jgi:fluoroquinolone transport system ATP-binding protein
MITVDQLEYTYPKQAHPAVRQISFHIEAGEIFGFLGPSGAGKSTTQRLLIKLLKAFRGQIHVMGKPLQEWGIDYYNHIGVGFELPNHYGKLSAEENLRFFGSFYERPVRPPEELLPLAGLEADAKKRVGEFSKGMKMRLNFLRAIMHDPDLLFFDEPTAGLDPTNARHLKHIILDLKKQGKTIFITTHNMQDAGQLCDRIAFLIDGRIELIDAPQALKLKYGRRNIRVEYANGHMKEVTFPLDGLADNPEFQRILREEYLLTMHTEEATLEEIFVEVTGQHLR